MTKTYLYTAIVYRLMIHAQLFVLAFTSNNHIDAYQLECSMNLKPSHLSLLKSDKELREAHSNLRLCSLHCSLGLHVADDSLWGLITH